MRVALQVAQDGGQPDPSPRAAALDGALRHTKQPGGVGDRIAVHVHGYHRGPLLDGNRISARCTAIAVSTCAVRSGTG